MADNLFSGLDKIGLGMLNGMELYEKEEPQAAKSTAKNQEPQEEKVLSEEEFILDKKYRCPVCDSDFKAKAIKTGKAKLLGVDRDLRPKYQGVDSLKYDSVVCPKCGYAALGRYFNYVSSAQIKLIREKITPYFKGVDEECDLYSYDEAIMRHQLALANAVIKKGKVSERAYICLKLAWLYRGKRENLPEDEKDREKVMQELMVAEKQYTMKCYEGMSTAMYKEPYPIAGMDEWTCAYLVANLAIVAEDYTKALKLCSDIIVSKAATAKLKDRARDLRKEIQDKV